MSSSKDLHPKHGARFVFTRRDDPADVEADGATPQGSVSTARPSYLVEVFLPAERSLQTQLAWGEDGRPQLTPALDDAAVSGEITKLARVLKRTPKSRLTRWRDV